ncbi:MAG: hypothetical protein Q8P54_02105 [bacterium]|nr:hypothetical protein [bacterium]
MTFKISKSNHSKLDKVYEKSMTELISFFGLNWKYNRPNLILVPDRKTIDLLCGEKTEDWLVGWVRGRDAYVLNHEAFGTDSSHEYSNEQYFALIKHELTHCFSGNVSKYAHIPVWLTEGISIYLSGQNKFKTKPKKLTRFIDFYQEGGKGLYSEAGFAVELLVKKHGKQKILKLLKRLKEVNSRKDFANLFKSIYGFELKYENFKIV